MSLEYLPQSPIYEVYRLLGANSPLEMSKLYSKADQELMKGGNWDYDNPELITNKAKELLEKIDLNKLSEEEKVWRDEVLWYWYHHAISCAFQKKDLEAAKKYSEIAVKIQSEGHPNQITKLLYYLVHGNLEEAQKLTDKITEEPEATTAKELLEDYLSDKLFFKG